jgi:hypothetical protein
MKQKSKRMLRTGVALLVLIAAIRGAPARIEGASPDAADSTPARGIRVRGATSGTPHLFFACCDQGIGNAETMFSNGEVISELKDLHAGLAVAISELSPARAQLVRRLNQAEIPVNAGLSLPGEQGYYLNAGNAPEAAARFADFEKWTAEYGLRWNAIGLDIEPNFGELAALNQRGKMHLAWTLLGRAFDGGRVARARRAYAALIGEMRAHGYVVETYQFLFLADERRGHSTMLERVFGIVDVRGDREVLMIYTSMNHPLGASVVYEYGPDAQAIAVGSTVSSGNPEVDAKFGPLNWEELSRNLIVASHFSPIVGVYSLEGCIQQGFLARMKTIQWGETVELSQESVRKAARMRRTIQTILWVASNLLYFVAVILTGVAWIIWWRIRKRDVTSGTSNSESAIR